jgi:hypothetical protein
LIASPSATIRSARSKGPPSTRPSTTSAAAASPGRSATPARDNAFSAPVYDHSGAVVLAVTAIGAVGTFDVNWNSAIAKALTNCTKDISRRLGYGATSGKPPNER